MTQLTADQYDTFKELINIGVGRAAGMLNAMLETHVHLQVPDVFALNRDQLEAEINTYGGDTVSAVRLTYSGAFSGATSLIFPPSSAAKLVSVLTGEDPPAEDEDLDALRVGTLTEVGNVVINGVMGSVTNVLKQRLHYSLPTYIDDTIKALIALNRFQEDATIIMARAHFHVDALQIDGSIVLWFEMGSLNTLLDAIDKLNQDLL